MIGVKEQLLASKLKNWDRLSDGVFSKKLSCANGTQLEWKLHLEEGHFCSRLTMEAPHPVVPPSSFGNVNITWYCNGHILTGITSWDAQYMDDQDLSNRMERMLQLMGLAIFEDRHAFDSEISLLI